MCFNLYAFFLFLFLFSSPLDLEFYFDLALFIFLMRHLQSCPCSRSIFVWLHLPSSRPVDNNMKRGLYDFLFFCFYHLSFFCFYHLCSILAIFPCSWYPSMACICFLIFAWRGKTLQETCAQAMGMKSRDTLDMVGRHYACICWACEQGHPDRGLRAVWQFLAGILGSVNL